MIGHRQRQRQRHRSPQAAPEHDGLEAEPNPFWGINAFHVLQRMRHPILVVSFHLRQGQRVHRAGGPHLLHFFDHYLAATVKPPGDVIPVGQQISLPV